jgi:hypothetical protein
MEVKRVTGRQLKIMMEGLITTVVEKICVLGWEDAKEDVEKLVDLVEDLEMFWDSDGRLTETDWVAEILMAIENAGGVV